MNCAFIFDILEVICDSLIKNWQYIVIPFRVSCSWMRELKLLAGSYVVYNLSFKW